MITETGRLPIGLEHGGQFHRDYELRPLKVKDIIAGNQTFDNPSKLYADCVGFALRLVKLGEIALDAIRKEDKGTLKLADMLTELYEEDLNELYTAQERLKKKLSERSANTPAPGRSSP
jgi:hypothetical protein